MSSNRLKLQHFNAFRFYTEKFSIPANRQNAAQNVQSNNKIYTIFYHKKKTSGRFEAHYSISISLISDEYRICPGVR